MLLLALAMENRKERKKNKKRRRGLLLEVFDTFATQSGPVHDVTHTDKVGQSGSTHDCVFATFKHRFLTHRTRNHEGKKINKRLWLSMFYSIPPADRASDTSSLPFHFFLFGAGPHPPSPLRYSA